MYLHEERDLDIVQVTINNVCNLECPHCYLNVAGTGIISTETISKIFEEPPAKIAIVGMEALHDRVSISAMKEIVRRGREHQTFTSMVTNGLGLKFLGGSPREELPDLIDISLDGGPKYYSHFRGKGKDLFPKIVASARVIGAEHPDLPMNVLNTLFTENAKPEIIADMIVGGRAVSPEGAIFFSPYIPPHIEAGQRSASAHFIGLEHMFEALRVTPAFMEEPRAYFFAGPYNAATFGLSVEGLLSLIRSYGLEAKSRIDTGVPHLNGGLRVLYDGYAIRPDYSIHTALYKKYRKPIEGRRLVELYQEFQALPPAIETLARRT